MLQHAISLLNEDTCSVAVITRAEGVYTDIGLSVRPLYYIYEAHKDAIRGACVADKVVGKAAAALLCDAGVSAVYGGVMSESALSLLNSFGISARWSTLVPHIQNRKGDDLCPMEKTVLDCDDPAECARRIGEFIATHQPPAAN